jgi:hypothetical protein
MRAQDVGFFTEPEPELDEFELCEDRNYVCCETLSPLQHKEQYGYPQEGTQEDENGEPFCECCCLPVADLDMGRGRP